MLVILFFSLKICAGLCVKPKYNQLTYEESWLDVQNNRCNEEYILFFPFLPSLFCFLPRILL